LKEVKGSDIGLQEQNIEEDVTLKNLADVLNHSKDKALLLFGYLRRDRELYEEGVEQVREGGLGGD
jgi:hypothetical protein